MTLNRVTTDIKTYSGQVFTTEKFAVSKIMQRVRLITGLQEIVIRQFMWEVIQDFCEKTWLLRKLVQVGKDLTEVDNDSDYYAVSIDLEAYTDGLIVHDINEIIINGNASLIKKDSYLGDPTGSDEFSIDGTGAYIEADTFIGASTYIGATITNHGFIDTGYHYEIVNNTTIKIWPVNLDDVILIPVVFKTDTETTITEIPYLLENYWKNIVSGIIVEMSGVVNSMVTNVENHERNYKKGISRGKYQYAKQYKGDQVQTVNFAL